MLPDDPAELEVLDVCGGFEVVPVTEDVGDELEVVELEDVIMGSPNF